MAFLLCLINGNAQNLLDEVNQQLPQETGYTYLTFKGTRLLLGHSVETRKKGTMELSAISRYWNIPERTQGFIVDRVSFRFGAAYAFADRFTGGLGITTFDGIADAYLKYKLLRQTVDGRMPLTITLLQNASLRTNPNRSINASDSFSDKLAFTTQAHIARKFTRNFSAQVSPTFIHRNSSRLEADPTNHFAVGIGGRYRLGGHVSIASEYYYLANPLTSIENFNAFALGVNWEMTDLMLHFYLSNAPNIAEDAFITQTRNNFNTRDGNLHFGFNAVFILHFNKKNLQNDGK